MRILVDPDQLRRSASEVRRTVDDLRSSSARADRSLTSLEWDARHKPTIERHAADTRKRAAALISQAEDLGNDLERAATEFEAADRDGIAAVVRMGSGLRAALAQQFASNPMYHTMDDGPIRDMLAQGYILEPLEDDEPKKPHKYEDDEWSDWWKVPVTVPVMVGPFPMLPGFAAGAMEQIHDEAVGARETAEWFYELATNEEEREATIQALEYLKDNKKEAAKLFGEGFVSELDPLLEDVKAGRFGEAQGRIAVIGASAYLSGGVGYGGKRGASAIVAWIKDAQKLGKVDDAARIAPDVSRGSNEVPDAAKTDERLADNLPRPPHQDPYRPFQDNPYIDDLRAEIIARPPVTDVSLNHLKYSQTWASNTLDDGRTIAELADDMRLNGWDESKPPPDMVQFADGSVGTTDHRRLEAARLAGIERIPATLHHPDEPFTDVTRASDEALNWPIRHPGTGDVIPEGTVPKTWGEFMMFRSQNQRKRNPLPLDGVSQPPTIRDPE